MTDLWAGHQAGILIFEAALLLIVCANLAALRHLGAHPAPARWPRYEPRVSVLVPARNEAPNIEACVCSLLAQDYPNFQVLVLNDNSTDETGRILAGLAHQNRRLLLLDGGPLPHGWLGKQWACHQLAATAAGELLLFTDADTRHHPSALRDAVAALQAEKADLLTALPRQQVVSWAESLLVPLIPWSILTFLPIPLAHRTRMRAFSAAIGQFMLFRREAYGAIGGHAAVRAHAADDLALARRVKAHGQRLRLLDGQDRIECRMYQNGREAIDGLSKNLFAAFDYRLPIFMFVWAWLAIVFLEPPLVLAAQLLGASLASISYTLAGLGVAGALLLWGTLYRRFGFPLYLTLLYPLTVALAVAVALRSLFLTVTGRATWKGRYLSATR